MGKLLQAFGIWYFLWVAGVAAQSLDSWLTVPSNKSALIVQISDMKGRALYVSDKSGSKLDGMLWESDLPLLQQYYLPAGDYELRLPTGDPATEAIKLTLKPGTYSYLNIVPPKDEKPAMVELTNWYGMIEATQAKIRDFANLGYEKEVRPPQDINPKDNTILFNTEPPFEIPIPKTPPPK